MRKISKKLIAVLAVMTMSMTTVAMTGCGLLPGFGSEESSSGSASSSVVESSSNNENSGSGNSSAEATEYTVTFTATGLTAPEAQTVAKNGKVADPGALTKKATDAKTYEFLGWFATGSDTAWDFDTDTVTSNLTLEARFTEKTRQYDVKVTLNGTENTYKVDYEGTLTKEMLGELPTRTGYELVFYKNGAEYAFDDLVMGDLSITLTTAWKMNAKAIAYDESADGILTNWRFVAEAETHDGALCSIAYDTTEKRDGESGSVKVTAAWCSDEGHKGSPAELTLGNVSLEENDMVYFYIKTTAPTSVWFGNYYDNHRFDVTTTGEWLKVTLQKKADKSVDVTIGGTLINYPTTAEYGESKDWTNLNTWNLMLLDRDDKFEATRGQQYNVYLSAVYAVCSYMPRANAVLATLPESVDDVDYDNAQSVLDTITKYNAIVEKYFSEDEKAAVPEIVAQLKAKAEEKINDRAHIAETMVDNLTAKEDITEENKTATLNALVDYLNYVEKNFTEEEKADYTEPEKVTKLRAYFSGKKYETALNNENITTDMSNVGTWNVEGWYQDSESTVFTSAWKFEGSAEQSSITLPKFNYSFFAKVEFGLHSANASTTYSYSVYGTDISSEKTNFLFQVVGGKLNVYVWHAELLVTVNLSEEVLNGTEGLKIDLNKGGYGWAVVTNIRATMKTAIYEGDHLETEQTLLKALPEASAVTEDNKTTVYAALVEYLTYVETRFTTEEKAKYTQPQKVTDLKTYFATAFVHTYTSGNNVSVNKTTSLSVEIKADNWYQDDHGNAYGGFNNVVFDQGDGTYEVSLPKLCYNIYSEVSFGFYGSTVGTLTYKVGDSAEITPAGGGTFYTWVIKDGTLTIHLMNNGTPEGVIATVELSENVLSGAESLKVTVEESGWGCLQFSHIIGIF